MIRLAVFLVGVAFLGFVALSWLDPERQPAGIVGLDPEFDQIDALYDAALEAGQPDQALEWVDEFLLSAGGGTVLARRAWDMRDAARLQGATYSGVPADRGQAWRWQRAAQRRPGWEWGLLALGLALTLGSLISRLFTREPDDDARFRPPPEHIEQVYGQP